MSYRIQFSEAAEDDLERLPSRMARRVARILDLLETNPTGPPVEAMRGNLRGLYRMRAGDHRVVYGVDLETRVVTI
ncbi:MAG: type II toxin-antitoxin system RelE/ParE family toxin [Armatimonadetes bacterium]|nr:type II toxin-antitoxin system RelE/ParE family toxin [Armatimonadota bacterium]